MSAKKSLPDAWIDALFARMLSIWGEKFTAQWRGASVDEMRATWAEALADVKYDDFRRGVAALFRAKFPPTLPEFRDLCVRPMTPAPALTDEATPTPRERGRELSTALRTLTERMTARSHASIDWARNILERDDVTPWQIEQASDAIRLWETTHHVAVERVGQDDGEPLELRRIPSPHIYAADVDGETLSRVPGEDDEPFVDPITHPEGETQS